MKITDKYVFFYKDWLSNYETTDFYYPSVEVPIFNFTSTEQGFMYFKALYFEDYRIADEIYNTLANPGLCRKLGRKVAGYDDEAWANVRYQIFNDLVYQKYLQDKKLQEKLLSPEFDGKLFVEASPIDRIWGIGLDENNPDILDETKWLGLNCLGKIITNTRNTILAQRLAFMQTTKPSISSY